MAAGVAAFDYDNDGHPDLYFTNGAGLPSCTQRALRETPATLSGGKTWAVEPGLDLPANRSNNGSARSRSTSGWGATLTFACLKSGGRPVPFKSPPAFPPIGDYRTIAAETGAPPLQPRGRASRFDFSGNGTLELGTYICLIVVSRAGQDKNRTLRPCGE